jgi:hypothetical protein
MEQVKYLYSPISVVPNMVQEQGIYLFIYLFSFLFLLIIFPLDSAIHNNIL